MTRLILASSSPYRRELLQRLKLNFECMSPDIDETQQPDEAPGDYVQRLAVEKAAKISQRHPDSLIIGSDQCSVNDGLILGKPRDRADAMAQLNAASGKQLVFMTAVSLQHAASGWQTQWLDQFFVSFRQLSQEEIERYVDREEPYNCAGSFKSEQLGIALCHSMQGDDPTALVGLPLIKLAQALREFGFQVP